MAIYWAKSTSGFYNNKIHSVIPSDAVEITETQYNELSSGQNADFMIDIDVNGGPALVPRPLNTADLSCTAWQIREALNRLGLRSAVESAVANSDQTLKDLWNYATNFKRNHPRIADIATAIGKTDTDIDALFLLAITLVP